MTLELIDDDLELDGTIVARLAGDGLKKGWRAKLRDHLDDMEELADRRRRLVGQLVEVETFLEKASDGLETITRDLGEA